MKVNDIEVFPWNENFETGIEEIDSQHKMLVALLNRLANTLVGDDQVQTIAVFDELAAYAEYHFKTEEAIWVKHLGDDPWLNSHMMSHASFLPSVLSLKERDNDKDLQHAVEEIVRFLIRWLAFHIIDDDKKMSLVINELKQGLPLSEAKSNAELHMRGSARVLIDTVLKMYDSLSSSALELMRERRLRLKVESELRETNARLAELSITDDLTLLYNRRYFEQIFERELGRARRESMPITLISLDIDYFKDYNDRYGHLRGDEALKRVSALLSELCKRSGDYVFRMGGEEFLVLLINQKASDAQSFAEHIRTEAESLTHDDVDTSAPHNLTVSLGVYTKVPGNDDTKLSMLEAVDECLYLAKAKGRNQVVSSGE